MQPETFGVGDLVELVSAPPSRLNKLKAAQRRGGLLMAGRQVAEQIAAAEAVQAPGRAPADDGDLLSSIRQRLRVGGA